MYRRDVRALVGLLLVTGFSPAHLGSGDSVQPRDTEAVIESVTPGLPEGVRVDIVGSDTFVRVRADGHEVEVPGYEGEPYVRISRDGSVEVNEGSMTAVLNGNRYGNVDLTGFVPTKEPTWRRVSGDGTAMWHDHRSHWMSPKPPAPIDSDGTVQDFVIPLTIDGVDTTVRGSLFLRDRASVAWWLVGLAGLVGALMVALARRSATWLLLALVSVTGCVLGVVEWAGLPRGARITPVLAMFALVGAVLSVASASVGTRGRAHFAPAVNAGAATALLTAVWLSSDQVRSAYVPGLTHPLAARIVLPLVFGTSVAVLVDSVMQVLRREA